MRKREIALVVFQSILEVAGAIAIGAVISGAWVEKTPEKPASEIVKK